MVVTCNLPTEHYSSGRALLLAFDTIVRDQTLSRDELIAAIETYDPLNPEKSPITLEELRFLIDCHENYNGDINAMCPPPMPTSFWIFLLVVAIIIMYMLGGKK